MRTIALVGWLGIVGALLVWQGIGIVRGPEWPTLSDFFRSFMTVSADEPDALPDEKCPDDPEPSDERDRAHVLTSPSCIRMPVQPMAAAPGYPRWGTERTLQSPDSRIGPEAKDGEGRF
jgi:hypothetical protein